MSTLHLSKEILEKALKDITLIFEKIQDENNELKIRIAELEFEISELRITPEYPL